MSLDQSIGGREVLIEMVVFKCDFKKLGKKSCPTCGKNMGAKSMLFPSDLIGKLFRTSSCGHFLTCSFSHSVPQSISFSCDVP